MKHVYAVGNPGNGTIAYAFESKKEREEFVAWDDKCDQRRGVTRSTARRYSKEAVLLVGGQMVADGYGPTMISL